MISEILILVSIAALVILLIIKAYNLMRLGTFYDKNFIFLGVGIGLICWILLFFGMSGLAVTQTTATITDSTGITSIVQSNNAVIEATMLFYLGDFLVLFCFFLSIMEFLTAFGTGIIQPRKSTNIKKAY